MKRGYLNVLEENVTKEQRQTAKGINFGFVYKQTPEGFQLYAETKYGLHLSLNECKILLDAYIEDLENIQQLLDEYEESENWLFSEPETNETTISFRITENL